MGIVTRGPRFTAMVGFDLGCPKIKAGMYGKGHYYFVLGWIEFHLLVGAARDLQLEVFTAGVASPLVRRI